jgi:hypothetical protein
LGNLSRRALYQGPIYYKGTLTLRANYEGLKEIFRAAFGTYASSATLTPALDDTFKEGLTLNSYSIELGYGDLPAGKVVHVNGLKIVGITVKGSASTGDDGILMIDLSVVARDVDNNGGVGYNATGGLGLPNLFPVLFHQAVQVDDGTTDSQLNLRITQFEATFEGPHVEDRVYLGSLLMDEPIRDDVVVGKIKFTQEYNSVSQWQQARAFTVGSPKLIFQSPTQISTTPITTCNVSGAGATTITRAAFDFGANGVKVGMYIDTGNGVFPPGTYVTIVAVGTVTVANNAGGALTSLVSGNVNFNTNRELEIRMNSANLVDMSAPIDRWGRLMSTATWEGFYDSVDTAAMVVRIRGSEVILP